jgi:hypothetical protein
MYSDPPVPVGRLSKQGQSCSTEQTNGLIWSLSSIWLLCFRVDRAGSRAGEARRSEPVMRPDHAVVPRRGGAAPPQRPHRDDACAGWHASAHLAPQPNMRLMSLPPYAPRSTQSSMSGSNCARSGSTTASSTASTPLRITSRSRSETSSSILSESSPSSPGRELLMLD